MNSEILCCGNHISFFSPENITAFSTIILALITAFYAYWTYRMVKISKEEFEISNRPYVSVATMDSETKGNDLHFYVSLKNSGKIPAILTSDVIVGLNETETEKKELSKNSNQTILNPGELIKKDLIIIRNYNNGVIYFIEYSINYKSPLPNSKIYMTKYKYKYEGVKSSKLLIMDSTLT